ncbi:olfactory receptor 4N5 [Trichinella spiralis]|uniref:Uncharacterized protein n=1 Tax=Trichinella spiralis TaxID=6334 RepID=E5SAE3_TRISP|nr:olfactory receptor 4N5 [Trichinella spiralis]KRY42538.1 hypothetical protein T01_5028 [Trichinella spiralis]
MSKLLHLAWDSRAALISTFGFALLLLCNYALILCRMPELTSSFQVGRCTTTFFAIYLRHRIVGGTCICMRCRSQNSVCFEVGVNCTPISTSNLHGKSEC